MLRIVVVAVSLSMFGCSSTLGVKVDSIKMLIVQQGKELSTELLNDALWYVCRGAPSGVIEDRFGRTKVMSDARRTICRGEVIE